MKWKYPEYHSLSLQRLGILQTLLSELCSGCVLSQEKQENIEIRLQPCPHGPAYKMKTYLHLLMFTQAHIEPLIHTFYPPPSEIRNFAHKTL